MNVDEILIKMMKFYNVSTVSELSKEIGIGQPAISKWKKNNSVNAVFKKCNELGIYELIFGENKNNDDKYTTINNKLCNFELPSLISLYFILNKTDINNYNSYNLYNIEKIEIKKNIFEFIKDELIEFKFDYKNDIFTTKNGRHKLNEDFNYLVSKYEIDYIFENKELFKKSILFLIEKKRFFNLKLK